MSTQSKLQSLSTALSRGLITEDQFKRGKAKLEQEGGGTPGLSKMKSLDLALERGLISPEQYENGKLKLQNTQTSSPENDPYSERREKSLKKLEGLPDFARKAYEKYLYPPKEKFEEEQRSGAKSLRNLATLPGAALDLPSMAYNLPAMLAGKQAYVPSQMIGDAIDTATQGYTKPETGREKINEAVIQSVLPMGALAKGAGYLSKLGAEKGSKYLQKIGNFFQSANAVNPGNVAAAAAGAAGTQHYINENPEGNPLGALGTGILSSYFGGKAGNNLPILTRPNAWGAKQFGINADKVLNQLPDTNVPGNFIPTTLADISDSAPLQMIQNSLEKTPLIGKKITAARNAGLEAETDSLKKQGFNKAREAEETGELALKGVDNYEQSIKNRDIKNYKEIEDGLKDHAMPFEAKDLYKRHKPPAKEPPQGRIVKDNHSGEEFLLTPDGNVLPIKKDTPLELASNKQSERKIIERYSGKSIDEMAEDPINLVPFPNTKKFIGKKFQKIESPEAQHDLFKEKFGEFTKKLDNISSDYKHKGVPYNSFQGIRKSIDDAVTTWGQTGKVTQEELKKFRRAMHKDTSNYLESLDPSLKVKWEEANKLKSSFLKKDQPLLNDIKKVSEKGNLEDVTKSLISNLKNSGRKVNLVSKGLNDTQKNILGYSLMNQIGKGANEAFDLFSFSNNFKKIRGNGKHEFLQLFPEENRESIARLARRMGNVQETLNQGNKSGTSYYNKIWSMLKSPVKSVGGYATSLPFVNLYTNKKFINWLSQGALINKEKNLFKHVQKLKTMQLGSNVLNDEVRSLYEKLEDKQ
jgi:hypothetical protein